MQGFGSSRSLGKFRSWTSLCLARRRVGSIRIRRRHDLWVSNTPFDPSFDLDLPVECDDEYWSPTDPKDAFKQPPGKPSKMSFFIAFLKLSQILAFALRTIVSDFHLVLCRHLLTNDHLQYSINKSKALLGFVGQQWEQHIVAELDSALNKWVDSVPDHRTFFFADLRVPFSFLHNTSSMGPASGRHSVFPSIGNALCQLLPPSDSRTSSFHPVAAKTLNPVLPIACNLYKRRPVVQPPG